MTLQEAEIEASRCWNAWTMAPKGPERDRLQQISREADRQWSRMVDMRTASPTRQLCIVAQMLREDTNE